MTFIHIHHQFLKDNPQTLPFRFSKWVLLGNTYGPSPGWCRFLPPGGRLLDLGCGDAEPGAGRVGQKPIQRSSKTGRSFRWWLNFCFVEPQTHKGTGEEEIETAAKVNPVEVTCEGCGEQTAVSRPCTVVCSGCRFVQCCLVFWELLSNLSLKFYMHALTR